MDRKYGVSQGDVYQLMAYARLYTCRQLMLLYPAIPGQPGGEQRVFGIAGGVERLSISTIDVAKRPDAIVTDLKELMHKINVSG